MKKYLLCLLLSSIFIFGYASASWEVIDDQITVIKNSNSDGYNPTSINFKFPINTYTINREISGGGNCGGKISASWGSKNFNTWNGLNSNRNGVVNISCDPSGNYICCDKVVFVHYGVSDKMPVSALSPAVDGLRGTVYQIIPYVIYIGIGVLISILGFYAIRWLVNWMGGKFNSYFRSKRN